MHTSMMRALALSAAVALTACGAPTSAASDSPLVGYWVCTGENGGMSYESTFDYRADGRYISTQKINASPNDYIQGGGGGTWELEGNVLADTKREGRLDRFVRGGVQVAPSDPEYAQIAAGTQANLGQTTRGPIELDGDILRVGYYTCERQRSPN